MIRRFARPYARAIMDVAGSPAKANELRSELMTFASALRSSKDLQDFYANPAIDEQARI
ncbi:MAG: F0F1 ATP synthase subunit delta, partial [Thermoanaerobaculia bacterium]